MSLFRCDACGCIENTADGNGGWEPPTWEQISDDGREDYRTRAKVFLDEYAKAGADASDNKEVTDA